MQEAEEERRVAERRQEPAAVGDEEDEEDDRVRANVAPPGSRAGAGGSRSTDAPVVPIEFASTVPMAMIAPFTRGVAYERSAHVDAAR